MQSTGAGIVVQVISSTMRMPKKLPRYSSLSTVESFMHRGKQLEQDFLESTILVLLPRGRYKSYTWLRHILRH